MRVFGSRLSALFRRYFAELVTLGAFTLISFAVAGLCGWRWGLLAGGILLLLSVIDGRVT